MLFACHLQNYTQWLNVFNAFMFLFESLHFFFYVIGVFVFSFLLLLCCILLHISPSNTSNICLTTMHPMLSTDIPTFVPVSPARHSLPLLWPLCILTKWQRRRISRHLCMWYIATQIFDVLPQFGEIHSNSNTLCI